MPLTYLIPLDPSQCPDEWNRDDLENALPPGLRGAVSFAPLDADEQPRFVCEKEEDAETAARSICVYLGAKYRAPQLDESEPW